MTTAESTPAPALPKWVIPAGIAAAVIIALLALWGSINSIRNECINKETQLSAQFRSNQNDLSAFISSFHETVGIADRKTEQLDRVIVDAVQGRYGGNFGSNSSLMTAIREAYPDTHGVDVYDKIIDVIRSGRAEFKDKQDQLLDQIRNYDAWRSQGIIRSWALSGFAPSNHLEARVGDTIVYGAPAEEKMKQLVLIDDATKAYQSGTMAPLTAPALPERKK